MRARMFVAGSVAGAMLVSACGGSGGSSPTSPSSADGPTSNGPIAATITITAAGVSPKTVTIASGSRVNFVNNDARAHDMASDPHPVHTDCPPINLVGSLAAGSSRATGDFTTVRTCGFHDHEDPNNTSLQGSIVIQ